MNCVKFYNNIFIVIDIIMKIKLWIVSGINLDEDREAGMVFEYDLWKPKIFVSEYDAKEYLVNLIKQKIKERYDNLVMINEDKLIEENFLEIMEIGKRLLRNPSGDDVLDFNFQISQEEIEYNKLI